MAKNHWYRLALSILLSGVVFWFWSTRFDELSYHTWENESSPIELNDAKFFDDIRDQIKPNSYVQIEGVLGKKAASLNGLRAGSLRYGRYQVRNLIGSKIYLEYDEKIYHSSFNPFTRVRVKGRLIPFGPNSELEKVRRFFKDYHRKPVPPDAMIVVVGEKPQSEAKYVVLFALTLLVVAMSFFFSIRNILGSKGEEL